MGRDEEQETKEKSPAKEGHDLNRRKEGVSGPVPLYKFLTPWMENVLTQVP